jgi:hypothetical protein
MHFLTSDRAGPPASATGSGLYTVGRIPISYALQGDRQWPLLVALRPVGALPEPAAVTPISLTRATPLASCEKARNGRGGTGGVLMPVSVESG